MNPYFNNENFTLYHEDSLDLLPKFTDKSYDMIFADPPYFLSNDGFSCSNGKFVSVNKGEWDRLESVISMDEFNASWLKECHRLLKHDGTIWVTGTHHNIYSIGHYLINNGFKILNHITWFKPNASPNLSCRYFTHSSEIVIWAKKDNREKHYFDYELMKSINNHKQMRDVWEIPTTPKSEKIFGKHPTQKPLSLLNRIVCSSTKEGDSILDPFNGVGTTGISSNQHGRNYVGIEMEEEYLKITIDRFKSANQNYSLKL